MTSQQPVLIIGQGLAGTALGWRLWEREVPFLVVDRDEAVTSSKVAAGLVTPVTGMRLNLSWRYGELYPEAVRFYRRVGQLLGGAFYHPTPIVRLLRDEKAAALWERRRAHPEVARHLHPAPRLPLVNNEVFADDHGGFQQRHAGWLDTAGYLKASRNFFEARGLWQKGEVAAGDLHLSAQEVRWQGRGFSAVVFCTGWEGARMTWFEWVPFRSARGSIVDLRADIRGERRIINRGCWVLPRADGVHRAGPTYEMSFDAAEPNIPAEAAVAGLQRKLGALLRIPFEILRIQTAVRPIIQGREALIGRHPAQPRLLFMNGLASKGALRAPWVAEQLTAHLIDGRPIPVELDVAANL
jgi:glycine/D-amino acid oxidase-like deaminating enzyme